MIELTAQELIYMAGFFALLIFAIVYFYRTVKAVDLLEDHDYAFLAVDLGSRFSPRDDVQILLVLENNGLSVREMPSGDVSHTYTPSEIKTIITRRNRIKITERTTGDLHFFQVLQKASRQQRFSKQSSNKRTMQQFLEGLSKNGFTFAEGDLSVGLRREVIPWLRRLVFGVILFAVWAWYLVYR